MSYLRYPTNPEQCKSCIFRTDGNQSVLKEGRLQEIKAYLVKGQSHMCHTDKEFACRGGRQFQAEMWHLMNKVPQPTIESLEKTVNEYYAKHDRATNQIKGNR